MTDDLLEVRTSERKSFGTCPQQWKWRYVDQLAPRRTPTPLWFGTAVHEALAQWYLKGTARGPHPADAFLGAIQEDRKMVVVDEEGEKEFTTGSELGVGMMNHYVDHYGLDEHMHILAIEDTYALIFKRGGKAFLRYHLVMDGLYRDLRTGQIFILEHKTCKSIRPGYLTPGGPLQLDNQAGSYYAAAPIVLPLANLLKNGEFISGITYNFLRKAILDDRPKNADGAYTNKPQKKHYEQAIWDVTGKLPVNKKLDELQQMASILKLTVLGEVSKDQPPAYFHREPVFRTAEERETQLRRIREEAHYMEQMRAGNKLFPIIKTPGDHCGWCPFERMCELHEHGDHDAVESFQETMMIHTDPYLTYRKKAA
jgi:hypothetical protein